MFSLLERKDVQGELKMAPEQVAGIARACHASDQDIPDLRELAAKFRKSESDPALSPSEKDKLRESFNSELGKCIDT